MPFCLKRPLNTFPDNAPLYLPLAKDQKQFRLLELHPGEANERVQCTLRIVTLKTWRWRLPRYETISYCWGDPRIRETVTVNNKDARVPVSCADALRRMRHELRLKIVWIDAVCIGQDNVDERGHQVGIMRDIYANGRVNLVYFGTMNLPKAKDSIQKILCDPQAQNLFGVSRESRGVLRYTDTNRINASYDVDALVSLFGNDWFKRLWVVQEAALSKENLVFCGNAVMNLLDITRAATILTLNAPFVDRRLRGLCRFAKDLNDIIDPEYGYWRPSEYNHISPSWLASTLQDRKASEPVDKVYVLLGLIPKMQLVPDYNKTKVEVYLEAAKWMIKAESKLNILQDVRHDTSSFSNFNDGRALPSWVPDWDRRFDGSRDPAYLSEEMKCSGHVKISDPYLFDRMHARNRVLPARGVMVGPVRSVEAFDKPWPRRVEEMVADTFMDAKARKDSRSRAEEILAMTLCAGTDMRRRRVSIADTLTAFHAYYHQLRNGVDVPPPDELSASADLRLRAASMYREAARRACKNRRFFVTWEGYCGLGPVFMEPQDVAVVLHGLNWPAILRPVGDKWRFLGLAYIYDIMDGEVMPMNEARDKESTIFKII